MTQGAWIRLERGGEVWESHFLSILNPKGVSSQDQRDEIVINSQMTYQRSSSLSLSEVEDALAKGISAKAPGPDGVPLDLFKSNPQLWAPLMLNVFKAVIVGRIPLSWRNAVVVLIFKKVVGMTPHAIGRSL